MDKAKQREYEKRIKGDVEDFQKEIAGIKKPEFPVGDTEAWRKERDGTDKEDKKK